MQAIAGTCTEHPPVQPKAEWITPGQFVTVLIPTQWPDVLANFQHVVDDVLLPISNEHRQPVALPGTEFAVYVVGSNTTAHPDRVTEALARCAEHYGIAGVVWAYGDTHAVEVGA